VGTSAHTHDGAIGDKEQLAGQVAVGLQNGVHCCLRSFHGEGLAEKLVGLVDILGFIDLGDNIAGDYHGNGACYAGCDTQDWKSDSRKQSASQRSELRVLKK
jgi:hypothetical protein